MILFFFRTIYVDCRYALNAETVKKRLLECVFLYVFSIICTHAASGSHFHGCVAIELAMMRVRGEGSILLLNFRDYHEIFGVILCN